MIKKSKYKVLVAFLLAFVLLFQQVSLSNIYTVNGKSDIEEDDSEFEEDTEDTEEVFELPEPEDVGDDFEETTRIEGSYSVEDYIGGLLARKEITVLGNVYPKSNNLLFRFDEIDVEILHNLMIENPSFENTVHYYDFLNVDQVNVTGNVLVIGEEESFTEAFRQLDYNELYTNNVKAAILQKKTEDKLKGIDPTDTSAQEAVENQAISSKIKPLTYENIDVDQFNASICDAIAAKKYDFVIFEEDCIDMDLGEDLYNKLKEVKKDTVYIFSAPQIDGSIICEPGMSIMNEVAYVASEDCKAVSNRTRINELEQVRDIVILPDYKSSVFPWFIGRNEMLETLYFPDCITEIENSALDHLSALKKVRGKGIEKLNDMAFQHCLSLESVEFPKLNFIGKECFEDDANLKKITLERVEIIKKNAFLNCSALKEVKLPSIMDMEEWAFKLCVKIEKVELGDRLMIIPREAFYGCSALTDITISNKVKEISSRAFGYCSIKTIDFAQYKDLEEIGSYAFEDCELTRVDFSDNKKLELIDVAAFKNNKIADITFGPADVKGEKLRIGSSAFESNEISSILLPARISKVGMYGFRDNKIMTVIIYSDGCDLKSCAFEWIDRRPRKIIAYLNDKGIRVETSVLTSSYSPCDLKLIYGFDETYDENQEFVFGNYTRTFDENEDLSVTQDNINKLTKPIYEKTSEGVDKAYPQSTYIYYKGLKNKIEPQPDVTEDSEDKNSSTEVISEENDGVINQSTEVVKDENKSSQSPEENEDENKSSQSPEESKDENKSSQSPEENKDENKSSQSTEESKDENKSSQPPEESEDENKLNQSTEVKDENRSNHSTEAIKDEKNQDNTNQSTTQEFNSTTEQKGNNYELNSKESLLEKNKKEDEFTAKGYTVTFVDNAFSSKSQTMNVHNGERWGTYFDKLTLDIANYKAKGYTLIFEGHSLDGVRILKEDEMIALTSDIDVYVTYKVTDEKKEDENYWMVRCNGQIYQMFEGHLLSEYVTPSYRSRCHFWGYSGKPWDRKTNVLNPRTTRINSSFARKLGWQTPIVSVKGNQNVLSVAKRVDVLNMYEIWEEDMQMKLQKQRIYYPNRIVPEANIGTMGVSKDGKELNAKDKKNGEKLMKLVEDSFNAGNKYMVFLTYSDSVNKKYNSTIIKKLKKLNVLILYTDMNPDDFIGAYTYIGYDVFQNVLYTYKEKDRSGNPSEDYNQLLLGSEWKNNNKKITYDKQWSIDVSKDFGDLDDDLALMMEEDFDQEVTALVDKNIFDAYYKKCKLINDRLESILKECNMLNQDGSVNDECTVYDAICTLNTYINQHFAYDHNYSFWDLYWMFQTTDQQHLNQYYHQYENAKRDYHGICQSYADLICALFARVGIKAPRFDTEHHAFNKMELGTTSFYVDYCWNADTSYSIDNSNDLYMDDEMLADKDDHFKPKVWSSCDDYEHAIVVDLSKREKVIQIRQPKKPKLKTIKNNKSTVITVDYKLSSSSSGGQIQVSTDKKFDPKKTIQKTISKSKKKVEIKSKKLKKGSKIYVRVRSFNGKKSEYINKYLEKKTSKWTSVKKKKLSK